MSSRLFLWCLSSFCFLSTLSVSHPLSKRTRSHEGGKEDKQEKKERERERKGRKKESVYEEWSPSK